MIIKIAKSKIKKLFKNIDYEILMAKLGILTLFIICILHAIPAGHYANFTPMNGTFQNYNPIRRLLAGQIPYKDFQDYLGMGHLYTGAIATYVIGGGGIEKA